jgi:hypothetical protein
MRPLGVSRGRRKGSNMQSNAGRAIVALIGVVVIVVAFIVISGGDDSSDDDSATTATTTTTTNDQGEKVETTEPKPETIEIKDGQPVGGVAELTFDKGDVMDIVVKSDEDAEIHLHGYDIPMDVEAGGKVEFNVPADIDGKFEMEIEETATPIAEITVNP